VAQGARGIRLQNIPGVGVVIGAFEGYGVYDNTIDSVTVADSGYGSPNLGYRADGMWILAICQGCKAYRIEEYRFYENVTANVGLELREFLDEHEAIS